MITTVNSKLCRISLWALLDVIKQTSLELVNVQLGLQKEYDKLKKVYIISSELKAKYNEENFEISDLMPNMGVKSLYIWCVISRK